MFSVSQKRQIAIVIEKALLELEHPEMPSKRPSFALHVDGKESWSWADITPNWMFNDNTQPGVNPWNEGVAAQMEKAGTSSNTRYTTALEVIGEFRKSLQGGPGCDNLDVDDLESFIDEHLNPGSQDST